MRGFCCESALANPGFNRRPWVFFGRQAQNKFNKKKMHLEASILHLHGPALYLGGLQKRFGSHRPKPEA
jgi:hypothetical protein